MIKSRAETADKPRDGKKTHPSSENGSENHLPNGNLEKPCGNSEHFERDYCKGGGENREEDVLFKFGSDEFYRLVQVIGVGDSIADGFVKAPTDGVTEKRSEHRTERRNAGIPPPTPLLVAGKTANGGAGACHQNRN